MTKSDDAVLRMEYSMDESAMSDRIICLSQALNMRSVFLVTEIIFHEQLDSFPANSAIYGCST